MQKRQKYPHEKLVAAILAALREYDASGDHDHAGGPFPGDCIRCAVRGALPPFARKAVRS